MNILSDLVEEKHIAIMILEDSYLMETCDKYDIVMAQFKECVSWKTRNDLREGISEITIKYNDPPVFEIREEMNKMHLNVHRHRFGKIRGPGHMKVLPDGTNLNLEKIYFKARYGEISGLINRNCFRKRKYVMADLFNELGNKPYARIICKVDDRYQILQG